METRKLFISAKMKLYASYQMFADFCKKYKLSVNRDLSIKYFKEYINDIEYHNSLIY